ncbi:MAG TPA: hypothetical protein VJQ50_10250 [Terriglobales bacterium]|nr:hypothetical protein [Terriglobales bacterium]
MAETIYNKRLAIINTIVYALALSACVVGLIMWRSWVGRGLMAIAVVWAVGGLKANWRAIHHGFVDLDNPPVDQ